MKKTIKTITSVIAGLALTLGLTLTSCKKGDTGPAGKDGKDGNANVVSSSITSSNWSYVGNSWEITFTYPAITQDIVDRGAVLVYLQVSGGYNQLPLTLYPSSSYSRTYEVAYSTGIVKIFCTDSDLTQPTNPGSQKFKIVVISASQRNANPNVNYDDYTEVKKVFKIKD